MPSKSEDMNSGQGTGKKKQTTTSWPLDWWIIETKGSLKYQRETWDTKGSKGISW